MVNYLWEDEETRPPMRQPVSVLDKRPVCPKRPLGSTATAVDGPRPRRFEDVPWRAGWRARRFLLHIWGPSQLDEARDPLKLLARERAERYGARARRAAGAG
jgi:hypothetical protein